MSIISQNRSANIDRCVCFAVDEKFFPYALFVADQIANANPDRAYDICVFSTEKLPYHPLVDQLDLRMCQLAEDELQALVPTDERITMPAYIRLFLAKACETEYRRILYLDADVFYLKGDLARLLDLDLGSRPVGAVRCKSQIRIESRWTDDMKHIGVAYAKYFNSGVLLIDVENYNSQGVYEDICAAAKKYSGRLLQHDQTLLNAVLKGNFAELSINWNFQHIHQTALFLAVFDANFVHFMGGSKPWNDVYNIYGRRFTDPYRAFFEVHFPALVDSIQDGIGVEKAGWKLYYSFLVHLLNAHRYLKVDDRHRSDWHVL